MDFFGKQTFAGLASQPQNVEHCPLLNVAQSGCSAHGVSFHQAVKNPAHRFLRQAYVSSEWRLTRLRELLTVLLAFPALDIVPTTTSLYRLDLAIVASHFEPCFLRA
jgi:hypothetical protein